MSFSGENGRKKIGLGDLGKLNTGNKIDFGKGLGKNGLLQKSNPLNSFASINSDMPMELNSQVQVFSNQQANQFRKFDFSSFKENNNKEQQPTNLQSAISNQNSQSNNKSPIIKTPVEQFRRPTFSFQKESNNNSKNNSNKNTYIKNDKFGKNNNFQNKTYVQNNKQLGNENANDNRYNKNFRGNFQNVKSDNNNNKFFKKSNAVKIKLKDYKKKDKDNEGNVFKKTSHTGSNVDKYSVNGMLKTMSSNIELDTEIDDVLGNVINVKLSGINSANALQKMRKTRVAKDSTKHQSLNLPIVREIKIYNDEISLTNLAAQMAVSVKDLVKILHKEGIDIDAEEQANIGDTIIDGDTAELIAENCGNKIKRISDNDDENAFKNTIANNRQNLKTRAPIVTIMGHVDHGKTTLLDTIRKTSVASGEAGGITQHIGAYRTKVGDRWITFLDTPGHAAFTEMRARGANVTDIVIIVVAADDGIMPQTEEAISHAKTAGVPIIVAINKIDKPEANIEKTKQMLLQYELVPEDLGGDVMVIPISAKDGKNVDKLLEAVLLQADVLDLKANYDGCAEGIVIESKMDKKRGVLATIIVKEGTLCQGDFVVAGQHCGKIKGMFDENQQMLKTAEPSVPVEILGLGSVPETGDIFYAVKNEKDAKEIVSKRQDKAKQEAQNTKLGISASDMLAQMTGKEMVKKVSFIIKADTKGSLEAIVNTIIKFENEEVKPNIAHGAVGAVNESDVLLASTCGAKIMTFNTQKTDKKTLDEAEKRNVEIRDYKIIYEMFDDIKDILSGKLKPIIKKEIQGHAEVKAIFEISKVGKIAGCLVKDGKICRGANVAILRNGLCVFETKCDSLKHEKENVKEIQSGQECGIGLEKIEDVKQGDILEFFTTKEEQSKLSK